MSRMMVVPTAPRHLPLGATRNAVRKLPLGQDSTDDGTDIGILPTSGFDTSGVDELSPSSYQLPDGSLVSASDLAQLAEINASTDTYGPNYTSASPGPSGNIVTASGEVLSSQQVSSTPNNTTAAAINSATQGIKLLTSAATPTRPTPTVIGSGIPGSQSIANALTSLQKSTLIPGLPNWLVGVGGLLLAAGIGTAVTRYRR